MKRRTRTRRPPGDGGPLNLAALRDDDRAATIAAVERMLETLAARELPVNQRNWDEVRFEIDPPGCSWRTTYSEHCGALMAPYRSPPARESAKVRALRDQLRRALLCVDERQAEIDRLKQRVADLESVCEKMARGTRQRRRRVPQVR